MISLESRPTEEASERLKTLEGRRQAAIAKGAEVPESVLKGYRDPVVKASVVDETHGKCVYCESKMRHVDWGDVEHIIAKSHHPDGLLDYDNLTLACAVCNSAKGDYHDPAMPLLNPYVDDPASGLLPVGFLVWHRPGVERAETTLEQIKLNRDDLAEQRQDRLNQVKRLADKAATLPPGPVRDAVFEELRECAADTAEYAFVVRGYLKQTGLLSS